MNRIDRDEIARLTEEYGGQWGLNHTRRILQQIAVLGERRTYDTELVWIAAHFSKQPRDLRKAFITVRRRMSELPELLCLEQARSIAAQRIQRMESMLAAFEAESFGYF